MAIFLKTNEPLPFDMFFTYTICSPINILSYKLEAKLVPCNFNLYIIQELHACSFLMLTSILNLHQTVYLPFFPWLCHFMQNFYYASEVALLVNYIKSIQKEHFFFKKKVVFLICPKDYLTRLRWLYPFDGQLQLSWINKKVTVQNISNIVLF